MDTIYTMDSMQYEHPWVGLELALESNNMTQTQFAELINKSVVEVNQIISGKRNITLDRAIKITAVFGGNPVHWIQMQADYDYQEYKKTPKYKPIATIRAKAKQLMMA